METQNHSPKVQNVMNATPHDQAETDAHAFIVRIWKDATDERGQATAWHGSIDHVGSSSRLYFHKLDSIIQFVRERSGINGDFGRSWRHWVESIFQGIFSRVR